MPGRSDTPRIYLLPNLMTAGNLFCGFFAILRIFDGMQQNGEAVTWYYQAIGLILGACLFDLLDGRMARIKGQASPFGREFDSLADIISFGVAPALLLLDIVLKDFERIGWIIAFLYLLAGAMRLARFNCMAAEAKNGSGDFLGFPIPAAAGVVSSLTMLVLWLNEGEKDLGIWRYALLGMMLLMSVLMMSEVRYPSFKRINIRTRRSPVWVFIVAVLVVCTILFYHWMPAILFCSYLLYGFVRPWISRKWRREIEESPGDDDDDEEEEHWTVEGAQ